MLLNNEPKNPAKKSSQNDDAEVLVIDWDQWSMDSFYLPTVLSYPLVCVK